MLEIDHVDLADLALALEDHSPEHSWWIDPSNGSVFPRFAGDGGAGDDAWLIRIDPFPAQVGYGDMEEFIAHVREPRTRQELERSISGRRAFRRFKDALLSHPELRRTWFAFHDARGEKRAIDWLSERHLVDTAAAAAALADCAEPETTDLTGPLDPEGVAHRVAHDLWRLYRDRLKAVVLLDVGGGAGRDAVLQLLVVLASPLDHWLEKGRMDRVMWRHSIRNDAVVTEIPLAEEEYARGTSPLAARALAQGVLVR